MNSRTSLRRRLLATLGAAVLATSLLATYGTSEAQGRWGGGGGGYRGGGRGYAPGGGVRYKSPGGGYGGGTRSYGGGSHWSGGWGGGTRHYGGRRGGYVRPYYYRPYRYYPRSYVSFGIGFGWPYTYDYYDPYYYPYHYPRTVVAEPSPTVVERDRDSGIDVENTPPAGCYYYDPYCDQRFSTLDEYTDHLDHHDHAKTIEIIDKDSGHRVRTLEFVDGEWGVRQAQ